MLLGLFNLLAHGLVLLQHNRLVLFIGHFTALELAVVLQGLHLARHFVRLINPGSQIPLVHIVLFEEQAVVVLEGEQEERFHDGRVSARLPSLNLRVFNAFEELRFHLLLRVDQGRVLVALLVSSLTF